MIDAVWTTLLAIGVVGLIGQLLMGGHFGHHSGAAHHAAHVGTAHHHAAALRQAANASDHNGNAIKQAPDARHLTSARNTPEGQANPASTRMGLLLSILSPMTIFSLCVGTGATGIVTKHLHFGTLPAISIALIGGLAFYTLISRPLMTVLLKFASEPSKALDGAVSEPAEVISHFDSSGRGLVNLTIDGQIVRVLAILEDSDKPKAADISPGDRLLVTYVDGHRNACRVAKI